MTRTLHNGVRIVREADAPAEIRSLGERGYLVLRAVSSFSAAGSSWTGWEYDTSLVRPPDGAILADPWSQDYGWGGPQLWYEDKERVCVQCGVRFTFSAAEQKFWYETLRFNESSTAIRCVRCRKRARTGKALANQLGLALRAVDEAPEDPNRRLELARVSAELRAATGAGDLDRGIDAARKAWQLSEERLSAALFWESVLQHMAGREAKALELEDAFLARAVGEPHLYALAQTIRNRRSGADR